MKMVVQVQLKLSHIQNGGNRCDVDAEPVHRLCLHRVVRLKGVQRAKQLSQVFFLINLSLKSRPHVRTLQDVSGR